MRLRIAFTLVLLIPLFSFTTNKSSKTAKDIVELIKKNISCDWASETVDTFKAGNPDSEVQGVAVCMFADMLTLKKAVQQKCNFIITHEPIFYNHLDETTSYSTDPVYLEKAKFIAENKLIVFRFHDHIHRTKPDGIYEGMLNKLDWKKNAVKGSTILFQFEENNLESFTKEIKNKLNLASVRVIGDPEMQFTKIGFAAGAPGGSSHISMLKNPEIEVLVAGEAPEWETYSYANDALEQGKNKAVIFLGHIKSEEAGMEYCASWLKSFVKDVPVHFIENKPNFKVF